MEDPSHPAPPATGARGSTAPLALALVVVASTAFGFFAGYLVFAQPGLVQPVTHAHDHGHAPACPFSLGPAEAPAVAGILCPAEGHDRPCQECHCNSAHGLLGLAKDLLEQGQSPEAVREELARLYPARVRPAGG